MKTDGRRVEVWVTAYWLNARLQPGTAAQAVPVRVGYPTTLPRAA